MKKIIFGCGTWGKRAFYVYGEDNVYGFTDNDSTKIGKEYLGKPIISPDTLKEMCDKYEIIIAVYLYYDIICQLEKLGVTNYKIFPNYSYIDSYVTNTDCSAEEKCGNKILDVLIEEACSWDLLSDVTPLKNWKNFFDKNMPKYNLIYHTQYNFESYLYGHFDALRSYSDANIDICYAPNVMHGIPIGSDYLLTPYMNNIVCGKAYRKYAYKYSNSNLIFSVGPYIHYANGIYSKKQIEQCKAKNGKTLLVFPAHSADDVKLVFNEKKFINYIMDKFSKDFDSVIVCAYWSNINEDLYKDFECAGAHIVSAGFRFDSKFINRLKSIIELSDAVITNGLGSYIPYSLYMNKPVQFVQDTQFCYFNYNNGHEIYDIYNNNNIYKQVLTTNHFKITEEQIKVYEPYAGFSCVKTKDEIRAIFNVSERIMKTANGNLRYFDDAVNTVYLELMKQPNNIEFQMLSNALPVNYEQYLKR